MIETAKYENIRHHDFHIDDEDGGSRFSAEMVQHLCSVIRSFAKKGKVSIHREVRQLLIQTGSIKHDPTKSMMIYAYVNCMQDSVLGLTEVEDAILSGEDDEAVLERSIANVREVIREVLGNTGLPPETVTCAENSVASAIADSVREIAASRRNYEREWDLFLGRAE